MRMPRSLISLALAASVLAGQWLAATHDSGHGLAPGTAHACAICVYALGAGSGALPTLPVLNLRVAAPAPEARLLTAPQAALLRLHPIRGPPQLL